MICNDWRPPAAYIYILHLDRPALAWEYLRRNPAYQADWSGRGRRGDVAERWGLRDLEDPRLDARAAQPTWLVDPDELVRLTADPGSGTPAFSVWAMPGAKRMVPDGPRLLLTSTVGPQQLRVALDASVHDGIPVAYLLRNDGGGPAQLQVIEAQRRLIAAAFSRPAPLPRPDRTALLNMRSLQALDGIYAGASQRAIGAALFGQDWIVQHWDADGELRNQVRYLIRRAHALAGGGYRRLLSQRDLAAQGESASPTDSP